MRLSAGGDNLTEEDFMKRLGLILSAAVICVAASSQAEAAWTVAMAWRREAVGGTPLRYFLGLARRHWAHEARR